MSEPLSTREVEAILTDLRKAVSRQECWSCDCLQGFLVQLEMDAEPSAAKLTEPLKVPSAQLHGCLGCDPCPPGAAFADYLRRVNQGPGGTACCDKGCSCRDRKE